MWRATFKWEAYMSYRHLRIPFLLLLALCCVLWGISFLVETGGQILWGMYMAVSIGALAVFIFYPYVVTEGYSKKSRLGERLSGRKSTVFAVVRTLVNIGIAMLFWALVHLAEMAHIRLGLEGFSFAIFLEGQVNLFRRIPFGLFLGVLHPAAFMMPAVFFLNAAAERLLFKRKMISVFLPVLSALFVGVSVGTILYFLPRVYEMANYGAEGILRMAIIIVVTLLPLPIWGLACRIYDNKAEIQGDFPE
ncbi:MAG: hypothetical protein FWC16_10070 [Defluviitaleaceae bacterium]|nr:hypothetical protein [Defluviitaleaceae bacterium]MCL2275261.1 hypothetical protein [Defluviitaleaceae bacterium]